MTNYNSKSVIIIEAKKKHCMTNYNSKSVIIIETVVSYTSTDPEKHVFVQHIIKSKAASILSVLL